jgi:hypothetical protein
MPISSMSTSSPRAIGSLPVDDEADRKELYKHEIPPIERLHGSSGIRVLWHFGL